MSARAQLVLQGPVDHLGLIWQTGENLLQMVPFRGDAEGTRHSVLLAVQEMVTNVLRHAHQGDEELPISVSFVVDEAGCEVVIEDQGEDFDPCTVALPVLDQDQLPSEAGGYGILIARMVMDQVEHRRVGQRNVLCMRKSVRSAVEAEAKGG